MWKEVLFQDWITIEIPDAETEVVQTQDGWIDTAGFQYAALMCQIPGIYGCHVHVDCAVNQEGPWRELGLWDTRPSTNDYSEVVIGSSRPDEEPPYRFDRYLRWRVAMPETSPPLNPGWVCFRMTAILKG